MFFFASVYAFVMLAYSLVFQIKLASWPRVMGKLVDEKIAEFGYEYARFNKEYRVSLSYRYVVLGREYIGSRLSPWLFITSQNALFILKHQLNSILREGDGMVAVYYNPRNPRKSFLIMPGLAGKIVTAVLSVVPLLLYVAKYYG